MCTTRCHIVVSILLCLLYSYAAMAQGAGAPVLWQHFGIGDKNNVVAAPALPAGHTGFAYSANICPPPGHYTIVRRVNLNGCFADEWIPLSSDYNSDYMPSHADGNMMLINYTTQSSPVLVYMDTIRQAMCPGTRYIFNARYINIDRPATCPLTVRFPSFAMSIENTTGQVLFTDTMRNGLAYANPFMGYKFTEFGISFIMPASPGQLVARITVLPVSSVDCAEDFAIDDIKVSAAGPDLSIKFSNEPDGTTVKSVCYQQNSSVSFTGTMLPFYISPSLQWQQSSDFGLTWTDIPGATSNTYTGTFPVADTFLFRLSGAETANISNPGCRVYSGTLKVEVNGVPNGISVTSNSPVCAGQVIKLNAEGGASYSWSGPNNYYDNVTSPQRFFATLSDSGWYVAEIITLGGCRTKDSTRVKIIGIDVDAWPADTGICKGEKVQLRTVTGASYEWSPAAGLSSTSIFNPVATPDKSTVYKVKVTDAAGCSDTALVQLQVRNAIAVKAVMEVPPYLCRVYDSLLFREKSLGKIKNWHWDFGNGIVSDEQKPATQYYTIAGNQSTYMARLAVTDTAGCTDTAYQVLQVEDNCYIAVPTAFTPNNDGRNDYLYPLNAFKVNDLHFRVYDRKGQVVFESRDWSRKWDGRLGGVEQTTGVYVWTLEYTELSGRKVYLKGTTTLIR